MEGRYRPPPASHPFPDNPNFDKFWNTPNAKGFAKFVIPFMFGWMSLLGINFYLTRNETHILGTKVARTKEEVELKKELLRASGHVRFQNLPLTLKMDRAVADKDTPPGHDLYFDDGIEFAPAYNLVVCKVPEKKDSNSSQSKDSN